MHYEYIIVAIIISTMNIMITSVTTSAGGRGDSDIKIDINCDSFCVKLCHYLEVFFARQALAEKTSVLREAMLLLAEPS